MTKRIKTPGSEAILAARKVFREEYPWAKEYQVRQLAILSVARDGYEAQLAAGQNFDLDALLKLDNVIEQARSSIQKQEPISVEVHIVDKTIKVCDVTCKHCGQSGRYEISDKPFDDGIGREVVKPASVAPKLGAGPSGGDAPIAPATADLPSQVSDTKPTANVVPILTYREGVSASSFHSAVINGREVPPLKKLQPPHYYSEAAERDRHPYRDAGGGDRAVAHPLPSPPPECFK